MKLLIPPFFLASSLLFGVASTADQKRIVHPVYVGARVCGSCHSGRAMGHQFSLWATSKHAQAFAALAKPEARQIAKLSGINEEPQEAAMCLGCHTTAAQAEEWEKDDTFLAEDGVQCERCHGPGSEYIAEEVMRDEAAARKAGLRMPDERDCMVCHAEKGSHVAVLNWPEFDFEKARKWIAHPTPANALSHRTQSSASLPREEPQYAGAMACAQCHKGASMGYQYSRWRLSAHSRAYVDLATPEALEIAEQSGIPGDPQESRECLRCHSTGYGEDSGNFLPSFAITEGITCEACHGPGSRHLDEAIMKDQMAAALAGLEPVTRETCLPCHQDAHGKPFSLAESFEEILHPNRLPELAESIRYKTPLNLALSPGGREIYVACEASDSVIVVDTVERRRVAEIDVGKKPTDIAFAPDGKRAFVSNRFDDTVSVIDVSARKVIATVPVGDGPHGLLTNPSGEHLYVLNTSSDTISIFDTGSFERIKSLTAGRYPWSLALSPDGSRILVTNALSEFVEFRTPPKTEISVIGAEGAIVEDRILAEGANLMLGVAWHPGGDFALATLNRTKNLVPMTRLLQGWTVTNGIAVIWREGRVDQVLLDEPNLGFPDPTDLAFTPDGRRALVTSAGSDRVAVLEVEKLISMLRRASPLEREKVFPNHLGKPTEFVIKQIPTKASPRGILIMPDGKTAYVANALDDSLTLIDLERLEALQEVDLGGPEIMTMERVGERLFNSADITFRRQFSCHTCHPDGHVDGITFDIEPDGIGLNPVDNRTLRGILDTAPFKWEGTNPSLQRQCGPRLAVFFTRLEPFTKEELSALEAYISTIPRPPNRFHPVGSEYTPAQRRGKAVFERTQTNDGRAIPREKRCSTCHPPPLFTDHSLHDIGTQHALDKDGTFDTPHLNNVYDSAPYLHNGIARTLEEIWTRFNPYDRHGVTNDLTKDQLNDLVEFLKTL